MVEQSGGHESRDTLDVMGHREEREPAQVLEPVPEVGERGEVTSEGRGIAGDIDHTAWGECGDAGYGALGSGTRRIEHHDVCRPERSRLQCLLDRRADESHLGSIVQVSARVARGPAV
jgi:hypothetical protein